MKQGLSLEDLEMFEMSLEVAFGFVPIFVLFEMPTSCSSFFDGSVLGEVVGRLHD